MYESEEQIWRNRLRHLEAEEKLQAEIAAREKRAYCKKEICTIKITVCDKSDHHREEDWVKEIWGYMLPWFTRRHGVETGKIELGNGAAVVEWKYESDSDLM